MDLVQQLCGDMGALLRVRGLDSDLPQMQNVAPVRWHDHQLTNNMKNKPEPNAYFEVLTRAGEIFGPFPHSWYSDLMNCTPTSIPFKARSVGAEPWGSWWRLAPLDLPDFVPPPAEAIREEWFRFLKAASREFCTPARLPVLIHASGFEPLAVEDAGFTCVSASLPTDLPARFDYENGGCCRVSISVGRFTRQPVSDSAHDKTFAAVEEWLEDLKKRTASNECVYQGGSWIRASNLERFYPDFYFSYFCQRNSKGRQETVIFALRFFGDNYLSIEFVVEDFRSTEEPRLQRLLEIIKRMGSMSSR